MTDDHTHDDLPTLADAATYFYDVCELWDDEDLDPEDHVAILHRAFMSSDCDELAWLLSEALGWQAVRMSWTIPEWGFGHHTMVRSPEGRLADVRGWTDEGAARDYFGLGAEVVTKLSDVVVDLPVTFDPHPEDEQLGMMVAALKNLGAAPFDDPDVMAAVDAFVAGLGDEANPSSP